jgi:hypothetical protein
VAEVASGGAEHGVHVVWRECDVADLDVFEVGGIPADLVDHPWRHLVFQLAVLSGSGPSAVPCRLTICRKSIEILTGAGEYRVGRLAPGSPLGRRPLLVTVRTIEI